MVGWLVLHNAQCAILVTGEKRLVPGKVAAGLEKEHWPFIKKRLSFYFEFIQCANVKVKREKLPKLMAVKGRGMLPTYPTTAAA